MPWPKTGATHFNAQLGLPDKGLPIKELVVCNNWDLEPLELINGLALGCYQPSPESYMVTKHLITCPYVCHLCTLFTPSIRL